MVRFDNKMAEVLALFVVERHDSLFVQDRQNIVGLILFTDIHRKSEKP